MLGGNPAESNRGVLAGDGHPARSALVLDGKVLSRSVGSQQFEPTIRATGRRAAGGVRMDVSASYSLVCLANDHAMKEVARFHVQLERFQDWWPFGHFQTHGHRYLDKETQSKRARQLSHPFQGCGAVTFHGFNDREQGFDVFEPVAARATDRYCELQIKDLSITMRSAGAG